MPKLTKPLQDRLFLVLIMAIIVPLDPLVNAQHIKAVPGRKTDVKDALRDWGITATWTFAAKFYTANCSKRLA